MPTGYTADLMAKGQDFRTFLLQCSRAFGATIMQRDDPLDAPLELPTASDWHTKRLEETKVKIALLEAMSPQERFFYGGEARLKALASRREYTVREEGENARLEEMEAKVRAWLPPSPEHQGLKDFMLDQIRISKHDMKWAQQYQREEEEKTPQDYFDTELAEAKRSITYHEREHANEVERTEGRRRWITQLQASVNGLSGDV